MKGYRMYNKVKMSSAKLAKLLEDNKIMIMKVSFLLLHKLWIIVSILAVCIIINIELLSDTYRFAVDSKATEINSILLTLSYSFLASSLFYVLNVWMPDYYSRKITKELMSKLKQSIKNNLSDVVRKVNPLDMNDFKEEKFVDNFIGMDLSLPYPVGEQYSIKDFIVRKMKVVDSCCNTLLQKYSAQLSSEEVEFLLKALSSFALRTPLVIRDFNISEENDVSNNQREYGESLLDLYQKSRKL